MPKRSALPKETHPSDKDLSRGLIWSLILHLAIGTVILAKSLIFPGEAKRYVPSLRVDLVGLPELTRQELEEAPPAPKKGEAPKQASTTEKKPPPKKTESSSSKEMAIRKAKQREEETRTEADAPYLTRG